MNSECHKPWHNPWLQEKIWLSHICLYITYNYSLCIHRDAHVSRTYEIYDVHKDHLWIHTGFENALGHYYISWKMFRCVSILTLIILIHMLCLLVSIVQLIQWSQDHKGVIVPTNFRSLSVTLFSLSNTCSVLFVFSFTDFP